MAGTLGLAISTQFKAEVDFKISRNDMGEKLHITVKRKNNRKSVYGGGFGMKIPLLSLVIGGIWGTN